MWDVIEEQYGFYWDEWAGERFVIRSIEDHATHCSQRGEDSVAEGDADYKRGLQSIDFVLILVSELAAV